MSPRFCWILLSLACSSVALAQSGAPARRTASAAVTITPRQGDAIVSEVWTRERQGGPSPDCSHLVHEVYAMAGFRYPYTDSFDLYAGIANFVRVTRPQAGDLVVWRGHVGIVVNPTAHSFYSSLRSGLGSDFYDAPYWKARGLPRFYRYVGSGRPMVTLAQQRAVQTPTEPVRVVSSLDNDSTEISPSFSAATKQTGTASADTGVYDSPSIDAPVEIPSSILVATAQRLPNAQDVAEAVSELNNSTAGVLREHNLAQFSRRVVIYDKLTIQHVDVKGQRGSVKILIDSRVAITRQQLNSDIRHEEIRWRLLRTAQGWEVLAQPECVYVPHDVAVHQLATRLALLTQDAGVTETNPTLSEQAQIVRVLGALMEGM